MSGTEVPSVEKIAKHSETMAKFRASTATLPYDTYQVAEGYMDSYVDVTYATTYDQRRLDANPLWKAANKALFEHEPNRNRDDRVNRIKARTKMLAALASYKVECRAAYESGQWGEYKYKSTMNKWITEEQKLNAEKAAEITEDEAARLDTLTDQPAILNAILDDIDKRINQHASRLNEMKAEVEAKAAAWDRENPKGKKWERPSFPGSCDKNEYDRIEYDLDYLDEAKYHLLAKKETMLSSEGWWSSKRRAVRRAKREAWTVIKGREKARDRDRIREANVRALARR